MTRTYENQFALVPNNMASGRNKITGSIPGWRLIKNCFSNKLSIQFLIPQFLAVLFLITATAQSEAAIEDEPYQQAATLGECVETQEHIRSPGKRPKISVHNVGLSIDESLSVTPSPPALFKLTVEGGIMKPTTVKFNYTFYDSLDSDGEETSAAVCFRPNDEGVKYILALNTILTDSTHIGVEEEFKEVVLSLIKPAKRKENYRLGMGEASIYIDDEDGASDSNGPLVSIVSVENEVTEGEDVKVTVEMTVPEDLEIIYDVMQEGDFLIGGSSSREFFDYRKAVPGTSAEEIIEVETQENSEASGSGSITIVLRDHPDYRVDPDKNSVTVKVYDKNKPEVFIENILDINENNVETTGLEEGSIFLFKITSGTSPVPNMTARLRVCAWDAAIDSSLSSSDVSGITPTPHLIQNTASCDSDNPAVSVAFGSNKSIYLAVKTRHIITDGNDGSITVALKKDTENKYMRDLTDWEQNYKYAIVKDKDDNMTIGVTSTSTSVEENIGTISFTFTATPPVGKSNLKTTVTAYFDIEEIGRFINYPSSRSYPARVSFNGTSNTTTFSLNVDDDSIDETDGSLTITLVERSHYSIDQNNKTKTVTIRDNDGTTVYIKDGANVNPGDTYAEFPIFIGGDKKTTNLTVTASVDADWDFDLPGTSDLVNASNKSVTATILANKSNGTVQVPINLFDKHAPTGYVTVTLTTRSGSGYRIGVWNWQKQGTAYVNGPEVKIEAISDSQNNITVKSGEVMEFKLIASRAAIENMEIWVTVTTTGKPFGDDYGSDNPFNQTVTLKAGETVAIYSFRAGEVWYTWDFEPVIYNFKDQSTINVSIRENPADPSQYSIDKENDEVEVTVDDNAQVAAASSVEPQISVVRYIGQKREGGREFATGEKLGLDYFSICADRTLKYSLAVKVKLSEVSGSFLKYTAVVDWTNLFDDTGTVQIYGAGEHEVDIPKGYRCGSLPYGIIDDETSEQDGIITLEVKDGFGYDPAAAPNNKTTVYVENDDGTSKPVIAIEAHNHGTAGIVAGKSAMFWIHFPRSLDSSYLTAWNNTFHTTVRVNITEGGFTNFLTGGNKTNHAIAVKGESLVTNKSDSLFFQRTLDGRDTSAWLLTVETTNTGAADNGTVQVTLVANSAYTIYPNKYLAQVHVHEPPSSTTIGWGVFPEISIQAISQSIIEGEDAVFVLESNPAPLQSMTVHLNLSSIGGDFIDGRVATDIGMSSGQQSALVRLSTLDDNVEEPDGSVTATIRESYLYSIAPDSSSASVIVVDNDDNTLERLIAEANRKILPEVVRAMGSKVQEGVESRVEQAFNSNSASTFEIDGKTSLKDLVEMGGAAMNGDGSSWYSVLGNSSFNVPLFPEEVGTSPVALWGLGDFSDSSRRVDEESFSWDGDMFSGQFGLDVRLSPRSLAGLSVAITDNRVDFQSAKKELLEGTHQVRMTSTSPYLGWSSLDRMSELNVFVSYGIGDVRIEMEGYEPEIAESSMQMASFGGEREIFSSVNSQGNGSSRLSLKGGALYARHSLFDNASRIRDTQTQIHQIRLAVVSEHEYEFSDGSSFNPSFSAGTRQYGGDGDAWSGMDLRTMIDYRNGLGLTVASESGVLFAGGYDVREWGIQGSLEYDRLRDGLGVQMDVSPSLGRVRGDGLDSLWDSDFSSLGRDDDGFTSGVDAELGYGFSILEGIGVFEPFSGIELTNDNGQEYRLGSRIAVRENASLQLMGSRGVNSFFQNKVEMSGSIDW